LDFLTAFLNQLREVFSALPANRKIILLISLAAIVSSFVMILSWINKPRYEALYSGLGQEEAAQVVEKLKEKKVPYKLGANGTQVLVDKGSLQETRLEMASAGLPRGGSVGMELFNDTSLSTTSFVQRLNYQRAIQGELERTIMKFDAVAQVRVHLNTPKETLFLEESREPSASVVIQLQPHQTLSQAQILGLVHLVASSVEGLTASNISVVDTAGGLIYKKDDESDSVMLTANQMQQRKAVEKMFSDRVSSMLEKVLGEGKAVARVSAELDFSQISTTEETFDPDRVVVRSEQRLKETTGGGAEAGGTPTARYSLNQNDGSPQPQDSRREYHEKSEETINYDITKIHRQTVAPAGGVKRLSVSVMVDGTYEEKTEGDKTVMTYIPRSKTEIDNLEEAVRHAIGYDPERGDSVAVTSFPFYKPEPSAQEISPAAKWTGLVRQSVKPALNVFLIFLFFLFVVRPLITWVKSEVKVIPAKEETVFLPELEQARLPETAPAPDGTPARARELALQNPERAVDLVRSWLSER